MKALAFRDQVRIRVAAGNGGDGLVSFRREKFVPKGGPAGGDGGRGGSVILHASKDVDSLVALFFEPEQRAGHGEPGGRSQCTGANGADRVLPVPCGTEVRRAEDGAWVGEVVADGDRLVVARGGKGGLGNCHFATSTHQTPREFTRGVPGEEAELRLDLKVVADAGLVGYPNAGKSTLLRALSAAHPKVAPYPFTTLHPMVGAVRYDDFVQIRVADVPGLVAGAHEGVGLGLRFLRHIERTRLLVFVLDMGAAEGRDPGDDYASLRDELRHYREDLDTRPRILVANKMDLPDADTRLAEFIRRTGEEPIPVMAEISENVEAVKSALRRLLGPAA